jgi:hypothetical protein
MVRDSSVRSAKHERLLVCHNYFSRLCDINNTVNKSSLNKQTSGRKKIYHGAGFSQESAVTFYEVINLFFSFFLSFFPSFFLSFLSFFA